MDTGEAEAIALAMEIWDVVDRTRANKKARHVAEQIGFSTNGNPLRHRHVLQN